MVGLARRVDFTPQLEVEVHVLDPATLQLIHEGKIGSGSLEFVPVATERRAYRGQDNVEIYHRLSAEPEHCGLSLVDIPGVPGADVLSIRSLPAPWAAAVIDPLVLNGTITDPDQIRQLMWLPHHDESDHTVDERKLRRALEDLEAGRITIPSFASLTLAQVTERARAHLERHTTLGLGVRAVRDLEEVKVNQWIRHRAAQYQAEGLTEGDALAKAKTDFAALGAETRAKIEGQERAAEHGTPAPAGDEGDEVEARGLFARLFGRSPVVINTGEPVQSRGRTQEPEPKTEPEQPAVVSRRDQWLKARASILQAEDGLSEAEAGRVALAELNADVNLRARLEAPAEPAAEPTSEVERVNQQVERRLAELARQPEHPMAAIASGIRVRSAAMQPEDLLSEVLTRTVLKQMRQQEVTAQDRQEVHNILQAHGISHRALTIEGNGTVIYEELARQFSVRPSPDVVFRNHFRSLPMAGTRKVDFPRFDRSGLAFQWNRPTQGGSTSSISATDPTLDTFPIEVSEMNGATVIADSFLHFNASGANFVGSYLLPEFRSAAQAAEDLAFWLGNGSHPNPATFRGLRHALGVTDANPGATAGVQFTEAILGTMLRAMPARYRSNPSRLAFYLPTALGDDFAEIRAGRATALGDRFSEGEPVVPGPRSIGRYRGIDVFAVPQLPMDETVGSDHDTGTAFLVHRDLIAIGDGLTVRIESHRQPGFQNRIELQEFVGLGYEWADSVVRHSGIQVKASV